MNKIIIGILATLVILAVSFTPTISSAEQTKQLAEKHAEQGLTCTDCHGSFNEPAAKVDSCLGCHDGYKGMAERTKTEGNGLYLSNANPHGSHLGNVECTECHKAHTRPVTNTCEDRCHTFNFQIP